MQWPPYQSGNSSHIFYVINKAKCWCVCVHAVIGFGASCSVSKYVIDVHMTPPPKKKESSRQPTRYCCVCVLFSSPAALCVHTAGAVERREQLAALWNSSVHPSFPASLTDSDGSGRRPRMTRPCASVWNSAWVNHTQTYTRTHTHNCTPTQFIKTCRHYHRGRNSLIFVPCICKSKIIWNLWIEKSVAITFSLDYSGYSDWTRPSSHC